MATLSIKSFPDDIYAKLRTRAEREHRSIAQEATHLLSQALDEGKGLSILELRGLGKELWSGIDATAHVEQERESWD